MGAGRAACLDSKAAGGYGSMKPSTPRATSTDGRLSPSASDKTGFLGSPHSYPEPTRAVTVIETHHAWVFLTDTHAYKMKKAFRHGRFRYSSVESRRRLCEEEYRLNLPLAARTYLGVVPLVVDEDGRLCLDGHGRAVEWLVKMRRLPAERMLDKAAEAGVAGHGDIERLMQKLADFHRSVAACRAGSGGYVARLRKEIRATERELLRPDFAFSREQVQHVIEGLRALVDAGRDRLEDRQDRGLVREVHGDLRPEHVCLLAGGGIEIIDRLEFDPDLRCLDPVEELAFFGLECRMIGQQWIEADCMAWYDRHHADELPPWLWHFYAARRAAVRAMLSAWHTLDGDHREPWLDRGRRYLAVAGDYLAAAAPGSS